jgi:8-oxo-dGTP pyrophosphatase MutT (NUDIX family)
MISLDHRIQVCGVVLLRSDGAALLQLRDDKPEIRDPGVWVFPGGHVEPNETLEDGARREFLEETTYTCGRLQQLIDYSAEEIGYSGEFHLTFFLAEFDGKQPVTCLEGQALCFVERTNASKLKTPTYLESVWDLALLRRGMQPPNGAFTPAEFN